MQLSHYLLAWPFAERPGYHLLFSTSKASLALIPDEVLAHIKSGMVPDEYRQRLAGLAMLVPDLQQERAEMLGYLDELNRLNPGLDVAVILGLDCNFACTYCYEGSLKGKAAMADDTADQLIAFIKSRFTPAKKTLTLDFYGGEPLLYTGRIKFIASRLKPFVEEQGAKFKFTLVTNGSLLTRQTIEELIPLGLWGAKVTVDGPAAVHDRCRPFKSGRGSFAAIMNNVQECCDRVKIGLGGNFTAENYRDFPGLLDDFEARGLTPKRLGPVQFFPVIQTADQYANREFSSGCASCTEPWMAEATLALREEVLRRGFKTPKMGPSPCTVDIEDTFVVHCDGSIYKCVGMIGHDGYAAGDVWRGFADWRGKYCLDNWKNHAECRECVYLPLCFGGCRYMLYQRQGTMAGVDCIKGFFDATLEQTLGQDVRYRYGRGNYQI